MIKRVLALTLSVFMLAGLWGCGKPEPEKKETASAGFADYTLAVDPDETILGAIQEAYKEGKLEERGYHAQRLRYALAPEALDKSYGRRIDPKAHADLSYDLQWMVERFEEMEKEEQLLVLRALGIAGKTEAVGFLERHLLGPAYADEGDLLETESSLRIDERTVLVGPTEEIVASYEELIRTTYAGSLLQFEAYLDVSVEELVEIRLMYLPPGVDSYSAFTQELHFEGETLVVDPKMVITLNIGEDDETLKGAFIHELFHACQHALGYNRLSRLENFLMESTAIWSVAYVDPASAYPEKFDEALYNDPVIRMESGDDAAAKTWYQMAVFAEREKGQETFARRMLKQGLENASIYEVLEGVLGSEALVQDFMADFGRAVAFENPPEEPGPAVPSYALNGFDLDRFDNMDETELPEPSAEGWREQFLEGQGYEPVVIHLAEEPYNELTLVTDIGASGSKRKTGMLAYVLEDGDWRLELDGKSTELLTVVDLKDRPVERVLLLFFRYGEEPEEHAYKWHTGVKINAEGTIKVKVSQFEEEADDGTLRERHYDYTIREDIELYRSDASGEEADYAKLIYGDVFYINNMTVELHGNYSREHENGDTEDTSYLGVYTYRDGDEPGGFKNNLLSFMPGMAMPGGSGGMLPDLPDGIAGPDTDLNGAIDDLIGSMGGAVPAELMEELTGGQNEIADAREELENMLGDDGGLDLSGLLPPLEHLNRFKISEESNIFHLYPVFPTKVHTDPWIQATTVKTWKDAEGKVQTDIDMDETLLPFDILPTWFYNPNYDPDAVMEMAGAMPKDPGAYENWSETPDTMSEVMDEIAFMNGVMDKSNLSESLNKGGFDFDIALLDPDKIGSQIQKIELKDNLLTAEITAEFIDINGWRNDVTMSFTYDFNQ